MCGIEKLKIFILKILKASASMAFLVLLSLDVYAQVDKRHLLESAYNKLEQADCQRAIELFHRVEKESQKGKRIYLDARLGLAECHRLMGLYDMALTTLMDDEKWLFKEGKIYTQDASGFAVRWLTQVGNTLAGLGDYAKAIKRLKLAVEYGKTFDDSRVYLATLNDYGNALWIAGHSQDAESVFKEIILLVDLGSSSEMLFSAQLNMLKIKLANNEHDKAHELFEDLFSHIEQDGDIPPVDILALLNSGIELLQGRGSEKLEKPLLAVHRAAESKLGGTENRELKAYLYGYRGKMLALTGNPISAIAETEKAMAIAQEFQQPDAFLWFWQLGKLYRDQGDIDSALQLMTLAVDFLSSRKSELYRGYRRSSHYFQQYIKPVYMDLVSLQFQKAKQLGHDENRHQVLYSARQTTERLKAAELEDFYQDECVTRAREKAVSLNSSFAKTAIIYPIILAESLEMLVTFPEGLSHYSIPVKAELLTSTANAFRQEVQQSQSERYKPYARRLYRWLMAPLEAHLTQAGIDTLIFVPEGVLRSIPFAALLNEDTFLIERFALGITPGMELTAPAKESDLPDKPLLMGISEQAQGYSALSHVDEELHSIRDEMGGKLLLNSKYTLKNIEKEMQRGKYGIVHMATHGVIDGSASGSFLLTYDARLNIDTLELWLKAGQYAGVDLKLLTLSACETAVGNERAGLGFAGIAVKAGADSAMASYWQVDDRATYELMARFYQNMKNNRKTKISKVQSLRAAQLHMLTTDRNAHPAFWAGFSMIGNWL